ncbi:MAG: tRNA (N6-threonylcarbamoyladenosine(37)-N6)-methyltransferase TrmO [Desulfobacteraceae bacterium]|nr:MAG: tRNA (N6-threonylcarbamoyladenosine(37)-N6)-methyltransferase TrmO [Desulfobacteraceae bacterium]
MAKTKDIDPLLFRPIGIIHTPFKELQNMPIQPSGAAGIRGTVDLYPEFAEGLKDLDGFSHLILLYRFHESRGYRLTVTPFLDSEPRGLFATRAPKRPNPIGLSIVKLIRIRECSLDVENVDILDGTPLLDIKPYVPEFDHQQDCRTGWLEKARGRVKEKRSDERFRKDP